MFDSIPAEKEAEWRRWADEEFGEGTDAAERAGSAVLQALLAGDSVEDAITYARGVASEERNSVGEHDDARRGRKPKDARP